MKMNKFQFNVTIWVSISSIVMNKRCQTWRKRGKKIVEQEDPKLTSSYSNIKAAPTSSATHSENDPKTSRIVLSQVKVFFKGHIEKVKRGRDSWEPNPQGGDSQAEGISQASRSSLGSKRIQPYIKQSPPQSLPHTTPQRLALKISRARGTRCLIWLSIQLQLRSRSHGS